MPCGALKTTSLATSPPLPPSLKWARRSGWPPAADVELVVSNCSIVSAALAGAAPIANINRPSSGIRIVLRIATTPLSVRACGSLLGGVLPLPLVVLLLRVRLLLHALTALLDPVLGADENVALG